MKNILSDLQAGLMVVCVLSGSLFAQAQLIEPGGKVEYKNLAFYPDRWKHAKISTRLVPWEGKNIVFLTTHDDLDPQAMTNFINQLDSGWRLYADLTGRGPRPFRRLNGRPTIAAVPRSSLTCGYGCGFVGATGNEASAFCRKDYPLAISDPGAFSHYYFYEMGRNYCAFRDRHSLCVTGFAVFMRYVCMDTLNRIDPDQRTRHTIEKCEAIYAGSDIPYMAAFTNLRQGEKGNRLKDGKGKTIVPSDQPVMYATAMLKLHKDCGGNQ